MIFMPVGKPKQVEWGGNEVGDGMACGPIGLSSPVILTNHMKDGVKDWKVRPLWWDWRPVDGLGWWRGDTGAIDGRALHCAAMGWTG